MLKSWQSPPLKFRKRKRGAEEEKREIFKETMNASTLAKIKSYSKKPLWKCFSALKNRGRLECCWDGGMTIKCAVWFVLVRMRLDLVPSLERNSLVFSPNGVEPISMDGLDRPVCGCGWVECRGQFVPMCWLQNKSLPLWELSFQPPSNAINGPAKSLPPVSDFCYINCANQTVSFQCRTRLFRISIYQASPWLM